MRRVALLALLVLAGCHRTGFVLPDAGGPSSPSGTAGEPPAVAGGTITTPPLCNPGVETQLTSGGGVTGFTWQWDGRAFVVAWSDTGGGNGDIHVGRFGLDGQALTPAMIVESTAQSSQLPTLAPLGNGWVVAWEEGDAPAKSVRARLLDATANPVGEPRALLASAAAQIRPSLARVPGGGAALAWMNETDSIPSVWLGVVGTALDLTSVVRLAPSYEASYPWLAGDDTDLGVVYSDDRNGPLSPRFTDFDEQMTAHGDSPLRTAATGEGKLSRMIKTSFGYLAAWEDSQTDSNEIHMALTDASGVRYADGVVEEPGTGDANWPNLAWNGSEGAIVYYQFRGAKPQIYLSYVDRMGQRVGGGADQQISHAPDGARARFPDVLWTGSQFAVAWIDTRSGSPQLFLAPVTCP
jgi:hypothetical protein